MSLKVVIPARFASSRLPGKPLADIAGQPMLVRVLARASQISGAEVIAAVDDQRVCEVVTAAGYRAVMTREDHVSGSDRVMEVVDLQGWEDSTIVVNVQGDEPLFPTKVVEDLVEALEHTSEIGLATLKESLLDRSDLSNPNVVKVVTDDTNRALYFSRAMIPFDRDADKGLSDCFRHIGMYAFRVGALRRFTALPESSLERRERLEQLRWLQAGEPILVIPSSIAVPAGVDTAEDLARVNAIYAAKDG